MTDPLIIIFGGNSDQLHQVAECIAGSWVISIFPTVQLFEGAEIKPGPALSLLIQEASFSNALPFLQAIKRKLPRVPVIVLAERPAREDIIHAFRFGVQDYLLLPLKVEELQLAIEKHGKAGLPPSASPLLHNWRSKLQQWFGIGAGGGRPAGRATEFTWGAPQVGKADEPNGNKALLEVEARFFGNFGLQVKGRELPLLPGEKVNAFFAYLLYYHKKPVHREILLSRFWEYTSPSSARKSLNVAVHTLRQHLNSLVPNLEFIQYYNDNYLVNPEINITSDVGRFLDYWYKGRAVESSKGPQEALKYYQNATALYQGDFLEDIHYEEWCEQERDNLKETYLILLDRLGTYFLQEEACSMAEEAFRKMLEKDPCLENSHRKLMLCYYRLGRRDKAIKQYYKCAEALERELKIEPSHSTRELFKMVCEERNIPGLV